MRVYITNIALLSVCLAWLVPFVYILRYGSHVVNEPNPVILWGELLLFVSLIAFAIVNITNIVRRRWQK